MSNATEGHLDQLVKARWLAIGLSQSDLAEVLGAAIKQTPADGDTSRAAAGRLMQIADALGFPPNFVRGSSDAWQDHSAEQSGGSLQSLLDLRLLRAFRELQDHRSKRMLIHLAEQMVRRQANRHGDAG
jgi:transcriptional regulator with XRE-family HTH domain